LVGKKLLQKNSRVDVFAEMASEFKFDDFHIDDRTLTIAISQSGETADTMASIRMVREKGGKVLSICNTPTSSMVQESDYTLLTYAGVEIAVASTKAYNTQLAVISMFVMDFAKLRGELDDKTYNEFKEGMYDVSVKAKDVLNLNNNIAELAKYNFTRKSVFYIGRGLDYYVAMEGSLKLKEISYIHSEAYAAGELKHGTLALIEQDVLVVAIITQRELLEKTHNALSEVKSRGATVITITPFVDSAALRKDSDYLIPLPQINPLIYPIISVIPTQFFSYYIARAKGCDIDKPRNLAKSVTVE
jgi:glucosamine--fructose-6-phosphate aminotransferase (isomerizing)